MFGLPTYIISALTKFSPFSPNISNNCFSGIFDIAELIALNPLMNAFSAGCPFHFAENSSGDIPPRLRSPVFLAVFIVALGE